MTKIAVYCPRLTGEAEAAWEGRRQRCRQFLRSLTNAESLEFETLTELQRQMGRQTFRRVVVALSGYYPEEFWSWAKQQRIDVLDVALPQYAPSPTEPKPEPRPEPCVPVMASRPRATRSLSPLARRETRLARLLSN